MEQWGTFMRFKSWIGLIAGISLALVSAADARDTDGVKLRHKSYLGHLVPASFLENGAEQQYNDLTRQAFQKHALLESDSAEVQRIRGKIEKIREIKS